MRSPKNPAKTERHIYIRITVNGGREEWSTGRRTERSEWDSKTARMAGKGEKARSINAWLETLYVRAHECRQRLYADGKPFTATHIRRLMQGEDLEPAKMLSEVWAYYTDYIAGLIGKGFSRATLQKYQAGYKALKKYLLKNFETDDIRLDRLDYKFIKDYEYFLRAEGTWQNNSVVQLVRKLRTMVRIALDFGWLNKDPFLPHRMKLQEVHRDHLTSEELNYMALKHIKSRRLQAVRDLFLFSCYTGMSYADTVKLSLDDVVTGEDGNQWVETHRTKNNNRVRVPLLPPAIKLIEYYHDDPRRPEGRLFPMISNQKANAYLKEIAASLNIKKRLTYHCARHTFATTVTLTNGVPIETVGQMLGHKNIRSTQHYARVTDTKIKIDMKPLMKKYKGQELRLAKEFD